MKQNNLNIISTTMMALILAVVSAQAAGAVTSVSVGFPTDIAVDNGNIYVTDTGFNNIDILNKSDILNLNGTLRLAGVGQIDFPGGVAVGVGNIYVADDSNNSIKVFNSTTGVLVQTVGLGLLKAPNGVAVDSAGNVYVADSGNNRVQIFKSNGLQQTVGSGQLNFPSGVAVNAGNVYVADSGNNRILIFNSTGSLQQTVQGLNFPNDVDVDSSGNIYVADTGNDSIKVFNPDGTLQRTVGSRGAADGQFDLPMGVAVDGAGNIYVADGNNNRVQVIAPTGVAGTPRFNLNKGWNLISIPAFADNSSVGSALANVSFNGIVSYDPATGAFATPASLQPLYGYWINVTANGQVMVFVAGKDAVLAPPGRNVYEGWNLIGVSASRTDPLSIPAGQLFAELKYGNDPTQWYYTRLVSYDTSLPATYVAGADLNDATLLNQGHGYWLFIKKIPNTNQNNVPWGGKTW